MKLDRQLQYEILNILSEAYPSATTQVMNRVIELADEDKIIANLVYLESHGLLTSGLSNYSGGDPIINSALLAITHRGMDFLVDDGGLSAILGTVTVKLHADTVKDLLAIEINHADLTPEDKKTFLAQLRALPAESTKHLVNTLVAEGAKAVLQKGPQAAQWLQTWMGSL